MPQSKAMESGVLTYKEINSLCHASLESASNIKLYCSEHVHELALYKWGDRLRYAQVISRHNQEARRLLKQDRIDGIVID